MEKGQRNSLYTQSEIIARFIAVHGKKYDYSKVVFRTVDDKVTIVCPIHGEFEQVVHSHIKGYGCPKCARVKFSTQDIINKFRLVHGDRYDYSKVHYLKSGSKVCIICPEHGDFWQKPSMHQRGQKCPKCAVLEVANSQSKGKEYFIKKAKERHRDKYDYSLLGENLRSRSRVKIICPKHGVFEQILSQHIIGRGCPLCANERAKGLVQGVGINDMMAGEYDPKSYVLWAGMLFRCYKCKSIAYSGVSVCKEWLTFSNFNKWFSDPQNGYIEGYHLDKDILVKGNKVYSPTTCCFVPQTINALFVGCIRKRSNVIGVHLESPGSYCATMQRYGKSYRIGLFPTKELAFDAYKSEKEAYIKEVAERYHKAGMITEKVYNALLNRRVYMSDTITAENIMDFDKE